MTDLNAEFPRFFRRLAWGLLLSLPVWIGGWVLVRRLWG